MRNNIPLRSRALNRRPVVPKRRMGPWRMAALSGIGLVIFILIIGWPAAAGALGEYDGIWIGTETISIAGTTETVETGSVFYQEDNDTMCFWDSLVGVVRLTKSGNQWILPFPMQVTFLGVEVTISDFRLTFNSSAYMTGTFIAQAMGYTGSGTLTTYKQHCTSLSNGSVLSNLSGAEGTIRCYSMDLGEGGKNLNFQTWGGTGDIALIVGYHRPDFDVHIADDGLTSEQIQIESPQSGLWYILLEGFTTYSGVNLSACYQEVPAPVADFEAAPVMGFAPLTVAFTDLSTGNITACAWDFGDGSGSSESNPIHIFQEPGVFSIRLKVTGPGGSHTEIKDDYVIVKKRRSMPWLPLLLLEREE